MGQTVEIPFWLAVVAGGLALVAILDRLLIPSVRWFFRRRINEAIDELNARLQARHPAVQADPARNTRRAVDL